MSSDMAKNTI